MKICIQGNLKLIIPVLLVQFVWFLVFNCLVKIWQQCKPWSLRQEARHVRMQVRIKREWFKHFTLFNIQFKNLVLITSLVTWNISYITNWSFRTRWKNQKWSKLEVEKQILFVKLPAKDYTRRDWCLRWLANKQQQGKCESPFFYFNHTCLLLNILCKYVQVRLYFVKQVSRFFL